MKFLRTMTGLILGAGPLVAQARLPEPGDQDHHRISTRLGQRTTGPLVERVRVRGHRHRSGSRWPRAVLRAAWCLGTPQSPAWYLSAGAGRESRGAGAIGRGTDRPRQGETRFAQLCPRSNGLPHLSIAQRSRHFPLLDPLPRCKASPQACHAPPPLPSPRIEPPVWAAMMVTASSTAK